MVVLTQSIAALILAASSVVVKRSIPPRTPLEYGFTPNTGKNNYWKE